MKYFFVSDIHGQYDRLIDALDAAQFDKDKDTLVSLGDAFDRGEQSLEVLQFLLSCPNKILIWGNHDLRLRDLMSERSYVQMYDYHNGVLETMQSFLGWGEKLTSIQIGLDFLNTREIAAQLWQYFDKCVYAAEWSNLIAAHAWIPFSDPWQEASRAEWYETTWENTQYCYEHYLKYLPKPIIVGHWHAWRFRERKEGSIDFSTFYSGDGKFIALDGCSNAAQGKVNVHIYETDEEPKLITGIQFF